MSRYFYTDGKGKYGPFTKEELKNLSLTRNIKVWCYGMETWTPIDNVPELHDVFISIPPETTFNTPTNLHEIPNKPDLQLKPPIIPQALPINTPKKSKSLIKVKWIIVGIIISFGTYLSYHLIKEESDAKFYKQIVENSYETNEDFQMYVDKFYRDLEVHGIYPVKPKIQIIKFSRMDQLMDATHIHGVSFGHGDDEKIEIYINPSSWERFNKAMKYILLYHELAHDVLNLDDLPAETWNEGKLMYPGIASYELKNMDDFIESSHDLFNEYINAGLE